MTMLKHRLNKLETKQTGNTSDRPDIIFICEAYRDKNGTNTSKIGFAMFMNGGGNLLRNKHESEADFVERAEAIK